MLTRGTKVVWFVLLVRTSATRIPHVPRLHRMRIEKKESEAEVMAGSIISKPKLLGNEDNWMGFSCT